MLPTKVADYFPAARIRPTNWYKETERGADEQRERTGPGHRSLAVARREERLLTRPIRLRRGSHERGTRGAVDFQEQIVEIGRSVVGVEGVDLHEAIESQDAAADFGERKVGGAAGLDKSAPWS